MWVPMDLQNFHNMSKALQGPELQRLGILESSHFFHAIIICCSYHYSHFNVRTLGLREVK